jgi:hypothetical protein
MHPSPDTMHAIELWPLDSATNFLVAVLILISGWLASRRAARWTRPE